MSVSLRASQSGRASIEQARKKKGWSANSSMWCSYVPTSPATLKRFREGKAINQEVFLKLCEAVSVNWEEVVETDLSTSSQPEQVPEFSQFDQSWVGREQLLTELKQKIEGSCRVLIITGITGIGKTALAEKLVFDLRKDWLKDDWTKFHSENFDNQNQASDFASVAVRWLEKWGQIVTLEDRKNPEQILHRLVNFLINHRYLIVMDSLELIMKGNEDEGWSDFEDEGWVKFFHALLASSICQSRLILTTQELPGQMPSRYKNFWDSKRLSGLEPPEQLALFEKTGLEIDLSSDYSPYLERIGQAYEGHPLALRVISGEIGDQPFFGNVIAYWNKHGNEIEAVEKAIAEAKEQGIIQGANDQWKLDRYTGNLKQRVRYRLEITFSRLEKDAFNAYLLLCSASIYRCAVTPDYWLSLLEDDCEEEEQKIALETLRDRYLLEESIENYQYVIRQHNLIRSVALEYLKNMD
ncbi:NB-ARC domain-containing protein [Planktothrix sp. FACHB-1365]|uniref:NB-ARC domain-containing protein n=1 Tax=Planktothrix sp. FACHB-1365 TaxID=2692855 RepID=UPI001685F497|nr:NB-ARC domain-containing protein [Planktothrix sp. FACHB-1365]MBD2482702.1 ATP-binding protein [Planktothrix sp. FACHB-1365]